MGLSSKQVSDDHLELEWTQTLLGSEGLELPKPRPTRRQLQTQQPDPLKCPRCESTNTKFCYYNNYNKSQPRHFCKACKRHWTKGGTLRNVPVGGGRKNKRVKRPNAATTAAAATTTSTAGPTAVRHNSFLGQNILPLGFSDHKSMCSESFLKPIGSEGILESFADIEELKGQVSWDFNGSFTGSSIQQLPHQTHQSLGFSILSSLSSFETNPSSIIPSSFASLSDYKDIEKVENVEDSTITTTTMIMPNSSSAISVSQPWQVPSTSNLLEPNYWNWNDIETMVLADLNKPWEDPQFKP